MRCVLYLRMSKDIQENSPAEQKAALVEYASKKGYVIVAEYLDEGISGDATEKRVAFQKMMADCSGKRFEVILCWDQDRFGRFDPLEAGYWIKPMRDAGVVLETIAQGRVDWNDFAGRLIWSVNQEAKHSFLRDIARNTLRGNLSRAKAGKHTGRPPFGYVIGDDGVLEFGPDEHVESVRRAFELRLQRLGYRMIGLQLTREQHPSPSGATWSPDAVRLILNRELYTGTLVYGRCHRGKYATSNAGDVGPAVGGVNITNHSPIKVPDAHPAIIDHATWRTVDAMHRDPPKPHANAGNSGAPLAGLLRCGMCSGPMYSQSLQRAAGQKSPNYICGNYMLGKGCGYCHIQQKRIHEIVAGKIRDELLMGSVEALAENIRQRDSSQGKATDLSSKKRKLSRLDEQIEAASSRLMVVNQRLFVDMERRVLLLRDQRNVLAADISNIAPANNDTPEAMAQKMWQLSTLLESKDPTFIRSQLSRVVDHFILEFRLGKKSGRGQAYDYVGCKLVRKQSS